MAFQSMVGTGRTGQPSGLALAFVSIQFGTFGLSAFVLTYCPTSGG